MSVECAECLDADYMDSEKSESWVNFIKGELQHNRDQTETFHAQNLRILERLSVAETQARERIDLVIREVQLTKDSLERKTSDIMLKQHALEIEIVKIQGRAGVWGFLAGAVPTIAVLLWYLLTNRVK